MGPILASLPEKFTSHDSDFDDFIETMLPELIDASAMAQVARLQYDDIVRIRQ